MEVREVMDARLVAKATIRSSWLMTAVSWWGRATAVEEEGGPDVGVVASAGFGI